MKCKICNDREAEVRDRNDPGNMKKTICRECQTQRLLCDMTMILDLWVGRKRRLLKPDHIHIEHDPSV